MTAGLHSEHLELHSAESLASALSFLQRAIVIHHQLLRSAIGDLPEAHHLAFGTSQHQRSTQAKYTFAVLYFAQTRVACGKHYKLCSPEIQASHLQSGQ